MTTRTLNITVTVPDEHADDAIDAVADMIRYLEPIGATIEAGFEGAWDWTEVPR